MHCVCSIVLMQAYTKARVGQWASVYINKGRMLLAGHPLALDVQRSELYCCACHDYIYDPDFDRCISVRGSSARVSQHPTSLKAHSVGDKHIR